MNLRKKPEAVRFSLDAAAQQQLQEIESLKAEAVQVPCGLPSFHMLSLVT